MRLRIAAVQSWLAAAEPVQHDQPSNEPDRRGLPGKGTRTPSLPSQPFSFSSVGQYSSKVILGQVGGDEALSADGQAQTPASGSPASVPDFHEIIPAAGLAVLLGTCPCGRSLG